MASSTRIKMSHAAVQVQDVSKSLKFFTEVFGFKPAWSGQKDWGMVKSDGTTLALVEKEQNIHPPHIGLVVDSKEDVDHFYQKLKTMNLPELGAPKDHRDQSRSFYFKDFDGNQFELLWLPGNLTE